MGRLKGFMALLQLIVLRFDAQFRLSEDSVWLIGEYDCKACHQQRNRLPGFSVRDLSSGILQRLDFFLRVVSIRQIKKRVK
jgi:hypothetical protein